MEIHATSDIDAGDSPPVDRLERPERSDGGSNLRLVVLLVVSVAVVGYLIVDGLESQTYFFSVDEALARGSSLSGREVRIKGKVVEGTIRGGKGSVGRSFEIAENGRTLRVRYDQALPDTFKPGVTVVATGRLTSSKIFQARKVLVKCPSRYEGKPPTGHSPNESSSPSSAPGS
ncbi:MAG: cytochrome c maturation protein CcmE [Bradymonadaceae bacterium]